MNYLKSLVGQKPTVATSFESVSEGSALNASSLYALSVFGQVRNLDHLPPDIPSSSLRVNATIMHAEEPSGFRLELLDDGKLGPDLRDGDGIFSSYFFEVYRSGYYYSKFLVVSVSDETFSRHLIGPSFFVSEAIDNSLGDRIPPARIMDLRIQTYDDVNREGFISLIWTAPGDNLNDGQGSFFAMHTDVCTYPRTNLSFSANHYKIYCGFSRTDLGYDDCTGVRGGGMVRFAHEAGTQEVVNTTLAVFGVQVYFGVIAVDGAANAGEMSNVASVFIEGQTTITTTPQSMETRLI